MSTSQQALEAHILERSQAKVFSAARLEWVLDAVEISDEFDNCPCGQEIKEHCYLRNVVTGHQTYVGNVCVNRFLGMETGTLFDGLKRIKADSSANANAAVIAYADERGYLFENEADFLRSTLLKRKLSDKQAAWKQKINRRILNQTVVSRRTAR